MTAENETPQSPQTVYESENYTPQAVAAVYVQVEGDGFRVFEVDADGFTIREYDTPGDELPSVVVSTARDLYAARMWPRAVKMA